MDSYTRLYTIDCGTWDSHYMLSLYHELDFTDEQFKKMLKKAAGSSTEELFQQEDSILDLSDVIRHTFEQMQSMFGFRSKTPTASIRIYQNYLENPEDDGECLEHILGKGLLSKLKKHNKKAQKI